MGASGVSTLFPTTTLLKIFLMRSFHFEEHYSSFLWPVAGGLSALVQA